MGKSGKAKFSTTRDHSLLLDQFYVVPKFCDKLMKLERYKLHILI